MLLSLVIPVFNAEKYIESCLDSVIFQLFEETELIIVNDASPDNSKKIVIDYISKLDKKKKIQIKHIILNENKGVGNARMIGINNSTGKYICSIDPDDIVANDYILSICNLLKDDDLDLIQFNISRFYDDLDNLKQMSIMLLKEGVYILNDDLRKKIYEQCFWSFCTRVIKKSLFEDLDFSSFRNNEDGYILPIIFLRARKIFLLDKSIYYYRYNVESLSKSQKNFDNVSISYNHIFENYLIFIKKNEILIYALIPLMRGYINFCIDYKGYAYADSEWKRISKRLSITTKPIIFDKKTHSLFRILGTKFLLFLRLIGK